MSFYSNFLSMCNSIEKTPSKVVTEVGLKKSAVTRWKAGGNPTDATAKKIADYFGVPVSELLGEKGNAPTQKGEREISDNDIKFALFGGDGEITDAMYDEVKRFAQMVKLREEAEKKKE